MRLEIDKTSNQDKIYLIERIDQIVQMHREIDERFKPDLRYPEKDKNKEAWGFYDYYNILGLVYLEFCGFSETEVYDTVSKGFKSKGRLSSRDLDLIKDKIARDLNDTLDITLFTFIPDVINDVILHSKMRSETKVWLIDTLFFFLSLEQELETLAEKRVGDRLC